MDKNYLNEIVCDKIIPNNIHRFKSLFLLKDKVEFVRFIVKLIEGAHYRDSFYSPVEFNFNKNTILGLELSEIDWDCFKNYLENRIRNLTTLI